MKILRPAKDDYPEYYDKYISKVISQDPLRELKRSKQQMLNMMRRLSRKQLAYRYEEGKWTIKEILVHIMDGERVFSYRALTFARQDQTELPGFDEKSWAPNSKATARKTRSILKEYSALRDSTIALFDNMDKEMLNSTGTANGNKISVRSLVYVIAGHEIHHMGVIRDKYIKHIR
jgi:uncharacterized damage-inducible protein DinB